MIKLSRPNRVPIDPKTLVATGLTLVITSRPFLYTHAADIKKPFDMPGIQEAIDALRVALHKKGVESHVQDAFNNLASCLVLLVCMREFSRSTYDQLQLVEFIIPLGTNDTKTFHCAPPTTSSIIQYLPPASVATFLLCPLHCVRKAL